MKTKNWMNKRWFWIRRHGIIKLKLEQFKEYSKKLEDCLKQELSKLNSTIAEEEAEVESQEGKDWLQDTYGDSRWNLSEIFPNILRTSLFTTCYSFFENELNLICELLQEKNECPVHYLGNFDNGKEGKGIRRAQRYLKKIIKINFPDQSTAWTEILIYQAIRNIIVHNDGKLDNKENGRFKEIFRRLEDYIKKKPSIHIDDFKRIQLSLDFILEMVTTIELFLNQLYESIGTYGKYQEI